MLAPLLAPLLNRAVTAPRWANSARKASPGRTGTIWCTAPGSTMSPGCRPSPKVASLLASQATQRAGLPRAAAPAPVSMTAPLRVTSTPTRRRSMPVTGVSRPPTTSLPEDALSATVSISLIFQSAMRLSTISMAGSTPAMAVSALLVVTPGPASSRPITKAISASTRGCSMVSSGTSSPSSTNMSSSSTPKSGSETPSSSCIGREVSPTLRPRMTRPAPTRRSMLRVWIA